MKKEFFAGKKVLIMGLGRFGGGVDAAKYACSAGAKVTITDAASSSQLEDSIKQLEEFTQIEYHLGSHAEADFEQADIIIVNPAVAGDNKLVKSARRRKKFITSQMNIFFELCPATITGITGANGKSTTAALTAHLLKAGLEKPGWKYRKVWLSGNIGNQPLLMLLDEIEADDLVVLELSSFQLEQLAQIRKAPKIALLTNLVPNHLDRYGTFEAYCQAKENIFIYQQLSENRPAVSIFNSQDKIGAGWFEKYKAQPGRICIKFSLDDITQEIRDRFQLPGRANLSNLAAAVVVAKHFDVKDEWIESCLPDFETLPHRLELVAELGGVRWYNDSKATTPEATMAAIEAFDKPQIIIAGGYDKHIAFDKLGEKIAQKTRSAILIGQTAEKIASSIRYANKSLREAKRRSNLKQRDTKIEIVDSLAEAVSLASRRAASGDVVLLSPACASYDMFDNYQQRGREFVRLVRKSETERKKQRSTSKKQTWQLRH